MKTTTFIYRLSVLIFALLLSGSLVSAAPPVVMKLLIIAWDGNDLSYQALTRDLRQIGVPYQAVFLNTVTPDASGNRLSGITLADSANGRGFFQGIIETDSSFNVCTNTCISLLSATDVTKLNSYAVQYSVRMVCYYGWPEASWGLQAGAGGADYTPSSPLNVTLTAAGAAVFPYLTAGATIPVSGQGPGIWAYKALPAAAANETTTPLLMAGAYTVGVTHKTADGRETMALTMDNYPGYLHSTVFSYGIMNWVTKGVFLGFRRVYLNPEIDDMLLGNRLYAPTLPQCPNDPSCPTYFASGADLQALANWQSNLQANPQFQGFRTALAYNGIGTTWFAPSQPVFAAMASLNTKFSWMSHTWDHANLDCYSTDDSGKCVPATLSQSAAELNQNIAVAPSLGVTLNRTDMVTPFNSGLTNPNFVLAAAQAGIQNIVYAGDPPSTQTGFSNPFVPSVYEIPRRVPDLYDDVSSPQTGVYGSWPDEYNAQYGPLGKTPTFSQNLNYNQIIDFESSQILTNNMLTFEPYPLAFHIDNMAAYDGTHSTMSDLLDSAITKYTTLFALPVSSLDLKDIAPLLKARASYDASGVTGVYTPGVNVVLTTTSAATIPVTGACSQAACASYAGQIQDSVIIAANSSVTLSLTAAEGITPASVTFNPASVTGGSSSTASVTLNGAAPTGGAAVSLFSDNAAAVVQTSVTVPAGSKSATFSVITANVTAPVTATISATYNSVTTAAALSITAPMSLSSLALSPPSVVGGGSSNAIVTLSAPAPAGGVAVALSSNNSAATVPASVTVAAGSSTAKFTVSTTAVTSGATATIMASYNGASTTAALAITVAGNSALASVSVNPGTVTTGTSTTGTVTLTAAAPVGGLVIQLWTTGKVAYVPVDITLPAGSTSGSFTVTTNYTTTTLQDTITAFYNGVSQTASVTVTP